MANIIKIKRSQTTATPSTLAEGELAYSELSGNLFIGTAGANLAKIGGNTDVLKLNGIEAGAQVNTVDSVNGATGVVSLGLQDLDDVTFAASPNLATGDVILYDGANWINVPKTDVGVTDHGGLTGLAADDHTQYHTDARGDLRYSLLLHVHDTSDITTGTFADARIAESNVTQHEATLSILSAQITDSTWISDITNEPIGDLSNVTLPATSHGAHRYWRAHVTANTGSTDFLHVVEMEMRTAVGGLDVTGSGSGIASSSSFGSTADNAFDNLFVLGWVADAQPFVPPEWIGYDFGSGNEQEILEYAIFGSTIISSDADPSTWTFEYSDDAIVWTPVDTQTGVTGWVNEVAKVFTIPPVVSTLLDGSLLSYELSSGEWKNITSDDLDVVHLTGAQTVAGAKTFSDDMVINGDLTVNGTTTTINSDDLVVTDNIITLNAGETGPGVSLGSSGILIDRGTAGNTQWIWNEGTDTWGFLTETGSPLSGTFVAMSDENHVHDASDITTGTFANARISQSNVTQHEAAINHDALLNFVGNEHIDHSAVTLTAGIGIAGGGDITASRTFDLDLDSLTALVESDGSTDYVVVYEAGVGHKKMLINNLLDGGQF